MTATTVSTTATPTAHHFASVTTLGKPLSFHESRVQSSAGRRRMANIALIFGIALLAFGGILMLQNNENAFCLVLPGAGIMALALVGFLDAKGASDMRIAVFEQGIASSEKQGVKTMRWEDVAHVFQILTRHNNTDIIRHGYHLQNATGEKIWWNDDVAQASQAWEAVRQQVYPRLLHTMSPAFQQGETLTFGEFFVNRSGVNQGKKSLAWESVQDVKLSNGVLTLQGTHHGKQTSLQGTWAAIPNAELLLHFVEQMRPRG